MIASRFSLMIASRFSPMTCPRFSLMTGPRFSLMTCLRVFSYELPPASAGGRSVRSAASAEIQKSGFDPNSFS